VTGVQTCALPIYINLEQYTKADAIFKRIKDECGESKVALFGRAQIAYKLGKPFKKHLDELSKEAPSWLVEQLKKNWEYKHEDGVDTNRWNAATAARYLGLARPFDLTRKAFNKELPCYFDANKGTVHFVKEELDCWVTLHNNYIKNGNEQKIYRDKLTADEIKNCAPKKRVKKEKTVKSA